MKIKQIAFALLENRLQCRVIMEQAHRDNKNNSIEAKNARENFIKISEIIRTVNATIS